VTPAPIPANGDVLKALEKIFLSPRVSVTVFLACASLLAANRVPALAPIAQHYSGLIWFFMLVSGFYSLTFPAQWAGHAIGKRVRRYQRMRACVGRLHSLTVDEKHILQEHLEEANGVLTWSLNRIEIQALAQSGLLGLISQRGSIGYLKLPEDIHKYLKRHPTLIATPEEPRPERSGNEWMI
jgi:Super-infection exclusion protein B